MWSEPRIREREDISLSICFPITHRICDVTPASCLTGAHWSPNPLFKKLKWVFVLCLGVPAAQGT